MPEITLAAETGRAVGTGDARRLRAAGRIPGVVYGHGTDPIPVSVSAREFRAAVAGEAGLNTLLDLDVDGTNLLTLARDVQRHPVRGTVSHIDFLIVDRNEVISADVSVNLVGDPVEVNHGDGIVDQMLFTLSVKARPADIPSSLELDISSLEIGQSLRVGDIALPAGVTTESDPENIVVSGLPPRVPGAATGAGEEGEGAEAAAPGEAAAEAPGDEG